MPVSTLSFQVSELFDDFLHAANHKREAIVIELVGCVFRRMIIRITKRRGVGDHDAGIAMPPK